MIIPKLISADSHLVEPPDLWTRRMSDKYGDRTPHQVRMPKGDAWAFPGAQPFPFGLVQCGGLPPPQYRLWVHWEEVRPETYDPAARLQSQDRSGVRAEVLYPSPRIAIAIYMNDSDAGYQMACIAAYNDWLSEHCALAPDRLIGLAMVPGVGLESAMHEAQRALRLPGIGGLLLNRYPAGGLRLSSDDDGFFNWCAESRDTGPYPRRVGGFGIRDASAGERIRRRIHRRVPLLRPAHSDERNDLHRPARPFP